MFFLFFLGFLGNMLGSLFSGAKAFGASAGRGFMGVPHPGAGVVGGPAPTITSRLGSMFGGKVATGLGGLGSGISSAISGTLARRLQTRMSPNPGDELRKNMDRAYPGTNPWERLGSGGGGLGSVSAVSKQLRASASIKDRELTTAKEVAKINARSHLGSTLGVHDPSTLNRMEGFIEGRGMDRGASAIPSRGRVDQSNALANLNNAATRLAELKLKIDQIPFERFSRTADRELQRFGILVKNIHKVVPLQMLDKFIPGIAKTLGVDTGLRGPSFIAAVNESFKAPLLRRSGPRPQKLRMIDRGDQGYPDMKRKSSIGPKP